MTLYDRIGGAATIEKLVTTFYQNVLFDPELQAFFADTSVEKLKRMQQAFFSIALGGPVPDHRISLFEAHAGRGIQRQHLTRFAEHLLSTLLEIGIEGSDSEKVVERISMYADEVLGESSVDG